MVEFERGAVVTLENCWLLPETEPNVFNLKLEILGSEAVMYLNTSDNCTVEMYRRAGVSRPDTLGFTLAAEAALVTRVLTAIEASARSGQPVKLD